MYEFLKEHLGEELYNQLVEKLKGNDKVKLANLADGDYVSKDKFIAAETKAKTAETLVTERDTQLETLKGQVGDNEDLTKQITDLQTANTESETKYKTDLAKVSKINAVVLDVVKAGPKDDNAQTSIIGLLDQELIKVSDDGKVVGLSEQLETIKKSSPYFFDEEKAKGTPGSNPPADDDDGDDDVETMSDDAVFEKRMEERKSK